MSKIGVITLILVVLVILVLAYYAYCEYLRIMASRWNISQVKSPHKNEVIIMGMLEKQSKNDKPKKQKK